MTVYDLYEIVEGNYKVYMVSTNFELTIKNFEVLAGIISDRYKLVLK